MPHMDRETRSMSPFETDRRNVNNVVQPLLTDMYQITMAYAYFEAGIHNDAAVFDLFFRKNPFGGEFTVFAGLEEILLFLEKFRYTEDDIRYLKKLLPNTTNPKFFEYLSTLTADPVTIYAMREGSVVFPRVPLLRVEGPLALCQLLETTLLNLVNFASLITTNAARYRIAAEKIEMLEFGLRRAQGPDGGLSASKYCYVGGCDATSNVLAGKLFDIPVRGTHAHAFVMSFTTKKLHGNHESHHEKAGRRLKNKKTGEEEDFSRLCQSYRKEIGEKIPHVIESQANDGELAAFVAYAASFPSGFLALIDTYDTSKNGKGKKEGGRDPDDTSETDFLRLRSGMVNFCAVALGLHHLGYEAVGVRIDSGDLAYLSQEVFNFAKQVSKVFDVPKLENIKIVASNDINETTIRTLREQPNHINCFGIGTNLVTCQSQPALGCVYKLVQICDQPTIKLSQDAPKRTLPGKKIVYRFYNSEGLAILDLMQTDSEPAPVVNQRILCRHPFLLEKRAYVTPAKVTLLLVKVWDNGSRTIDGASRSLTEIKHDLSNSLATIRQDIKRHLNPTPYKVSVTENLYNEFTSLYMESAPIGEL